MALEVRDGFLEEAIIMEKAARRDLYTVVWTRMHRSG